MCAPEDEWWTEFDVDVAGGRPPIFSAMSEAVVEAEPSLLQSLRAEKGRRLSCARRPRAFTTMSYAFDAVSVRTFSDFDCCEFNVDESEVGCASMMSGRSEFEVDVSSGRPPVFSSSSIDGEAAALHEAALRTRPFPGPRLQPGGGGG